MRCFNEPGLWKLNLISFGLIFGHVGLGYDVTLVSGLLSNKRWLQDLQVEIGTPFLGALCAALVFGAVASAFPAAFAADKFGRRRTLLIACAIKTIAVVGECTTHDRATWLALRIVAGFGTGTTTTTSSILVNELNHHSQRAEFTALLPACFYIGSIVASLCTFGSSGFDSRWSWRLPTLLQAVWPLLLSIVVCFCPESPRWLASVGRISEAKRHIERYFAKVDANPADCALEHILESVENAKRVGDSSWLAFFHRRNLKRTILVVFLGASAQWVGMGVVSFYLPPALATVGISNPHQQQLLNIGLQICNLTAASVGAALSDRSGRKALLIASTCAMLSFMIAITASAGVYAHFEQRGAAIAFVVFLFAFSAAYDVGFTPIPSLYCSELFPTEMRAKASALLSWTAGIALIFNIYVNPIALKAIHWKYYAVYIAFLIFTLLLIAPFAPETKGLSLEEASNVPNQSLQKLDCVPHGETAAEDREGDTCSGKQSEPGKIEEYKLASVQNGVPPQPPVAALRISIGQKDDGIRP